MTICTNPRCQTTAGCICGDPTFPSVLSLPNPRTLDIKVPITEFGTTIVVLKGAGDLIVKIDVPADIVQDILFRLENN